MIKAKPSPILVPLSRFLAKSLRFRSWPAARALILASLLLVNMPALLSACQAKPVVVVYTSVDQVYSEPIFLQFSQQTGITVKPVYDIEAAKTVGLANRLIAEKAKPQADVFWNGEILQTLALKANGVLAPADIAAAADLPVSFVDTDRTWFAWGGRARILLVNQSLIQLADCPGSLADLASYPHLQQAGMAYPVFGTTATQAAALYAMWGERQARQFFTSLQAGGIQILEGNSVVKDYVSARKLAFGLTDTDDALAAMAGNPDLAIVLLDQQPGGMGTMVIPNSVAMIRGAPHPETADAFIEFLLARSTEQSLVDAGWIQVPVHAAVKPPASLATGPVHLMTVDFNAAFTCYEQSKADMSTIFVR